jgi:hypothetical protein
MEDVSVLKGGKPRSCFVRFAVAFTGVMLCVLVYAPRFSTLNTSYGTTTTDFPVTTATGVVVEEVAEDGGVAALDLDNQVGSPCASMPRHGICCDRSDGNADVCFMAGDVRTDAATLSLLLFPPACVPAAAEVEERIRPYTCKWDGIVTKLIHEVTLCAARPEEQEAAAHRCDVRHDAPVHVVTAGGYNGGNYFHAFNDGFLPAWLTTQHLSRRVVLGVLAYQPAWETRYAEVVAGLSDRPALDLVGDNRTHCFPGAVVGTRLHGYLSVHPARLRDNKTVHDFHRFLANVYHKPQQDGPRQQEEGQRPRLGIVSRHGTRVIENEAAVARLAERAGFDVAIIEAGKTTTPPLASLHATVSGLDALVGAHGSDLTSFLFLRPGRAALVQVAPLGLTGLSRGLFGAPAARMGLRYEQYDVRGNESSLSRVYGPGHVVVADPDRAVRRKGRDWEFIGRVYLGGQNVSLDLARFGETLARLHSWVLQQRDDGS